MLRIGDFARLAQVSVKALRFYDEIGLLRPTSVDRHTGYRYYDPHLLSRLNHILAFKELGFSLSEILSLFQAPLSDKHLRTILERKRSELRRSIAREKVQLARLEDWLRELPATPREADSPFALKQSPSLLVASVRETLGGYDEAENLFDELQHYLRRYQRVGQRAAIWHACAASGHSIECEALILLHKPVPQSKRVRVFELPASTTAAAVHLGEDDTIEDTYRGLRVWIKSQGYNPTGANLEFYWPQANSKRPNAYLTEIQFPVSITTRAADN
ncbi:MAG TPA: MerR family transcriptional regulator [Blastocatellia bacterium]|nr:MerR family transcriptional regulator [Blastocatellia bacterium]